MCRCHVNVYDTPVGDPLLDRGPGDRPGLTARQGAVGLFCFHCERASEMWLFVKYKVDLASTYYRQTWYVQGWMSLDISIGRCLIEAYVVSGIVVIAAINS